MAAYLDGVLVYNRFLFFQFLKHLWLHWSKISQSNECTVKSYIIQILQTLIGSLDISVTWQTAADWITSLPNLQNTFNAFVQHYNCLVFLCTDVTFSCLHCRLDKLVQTAAQAASSQDQSKSRDNDNKFALKLASLPPVDGAWHLIQAIAVVLQEFHVVRQEV